MRVRFWGTRGSIATPGHFTARYGGNTSCVEVITAAGERFIIDCGTGARELGLRLVADGPKPLRASILLTHTHWDHIQGFPFFAPLFVPGNEIAVYAPEGAGRSLAETLAGQMEFNYFPVELGQLPAKIAYRDLGEGVHKIGGVHVIAQYLNHPAMTLAYRIEADGAAVVYACDHEPFSTSMWRTGAPSGCIESILHNGDRRHAQFLAGADLVIHDAQYTPEEYPSKKNWGHSTYEYAVMVAVAAGAKRLALTHHDPTHTDAFVERLEADARSLTVHYKSSLVVFAAYEGCEIVTSDVSETASGTVAVASAGRFAKPEEVRVLIVDDDEALRVLAQAALKTGGYAVLEASSGEEALRLALEHKPDLVLLDLIMPGLDGLEVLKILRGQPETVALPVILLTAHSDEPHTRAGFDAGANDYLAKPFTIPQLIARVRTCLRRATSTE